LAISGLGLTNLSSFQSKHRLKEKLSFCPNRPVKLIDTIDPLVAASDRISVNEGYFKKILSLGKILIT